MAFTWRPAEERRFKIEHWLLILVFLTLPLEGLGLLNRAGGTVAGGITIAKLVILLTLVVWAARVLFTQDRYLVFSIFGVPTTFLLVGGLIVAFSTIINARIRPYFGQVLIQTISLFLLYLLMINVIQARKKLFAWCLAALLVGSFANSMGGMYEMVTGDRIMKKRSFTAAIPEDSQFGKQRSFYTTDAGKNRIASFSGDTGLHGVHWAVYGALSLCVPLIARKWRWRAAGWVFAAITCINCVATGTRTGIFGLIGGVAIFFTFVKMRNKLQVVFVGLVVTFVLSAMLGAPIERILGRGQKAQMSVDWRIYQGKMAYQMILDHPILGVGLGNYLGRYYHYSHKVPEAHKFPNIMHNGFLAVWAEQGTLGLVFFLSIFASVITILLRLMRDAAQPWVHHVAVGLLAALTAHLITQLSYPLLNDEQGYFLMGFSVALYAVNRQLRGEQPYSADPGQLQPAYV